MTYSVNRSWSVLLYPIHSTPSRRSPIHHTIKRQLAQQAIARFPSMPDGHTQNHKRNALETINHGVDQTQLRNHVSENNVQPHPSRPSSAEWQESSRKKSLLGQSLDEIKSWGRPFYPVEVHDIRYHGLCMRVEEMDDIEVQFAGIYPERISNAGDYILTPDNPEKLESFSDQALLIPQFKLSDEQEKIFNLMKTGRNIYFTGKAGSGKTAIIHCYTEWASQNNRQVDLLAPTGIAASLIDGNTIHSFCGISPRINLTAVQQKLEQEISMQTLGFKTDETEIPDSFVYSSPQEEKARRDPFANASAKTRFENCDVMIIDEISMVNAELLSFVDTLARYYRPSKRHQIFGGIQMIFSGDFLQLPPVVKKVHNEAPQEMDPNIAVEKFTRDSHLCNYLYRENDQKKLGFLARHAMNDPFVFKSSIWQSLLRDGMIQVQLSQSFRQQDARFVALLDDIRYGVNSKELIETLEPCFFRNWNDSILPTRLTAYRRAAQFYNEIELGKLPGKSLNYVASDSVQFPQNQYDQEKDDIWAVAMTYSANLMDTQFEEFQVPRVLQLKIGAQVILLRNIRTTSGLVNGSRGVVVGFEETWDEFLRRNVTLPIVRFIDGRSFVIGYHAFESVCHSPYNAEKPLRIWRYQVPVKLGWALTIHKSQGLTLDRVEIDLPDAFAPGLAYVAFSRVKTMEGLKLRNFTDRSLLVSACAKEFHLSLSDANGVL